MPILTNTNVSRVFNFGVEATEGLAVTANKRLPDLKFTPGWKRTSQTYTPSGYKVPTINVNGKEWAIFTVEGPIGYGSLVYFLSSGQNYLAPVARGNGYQWQATPNPNAVNASKTFTIEYGNAAAAFRVAGAHVVNLSVHLEYDKPTFKAEMAGQVPIPGITLTASPTIIENVPVTGPSVDVFTATSWANLSMAPTQLLNAYTYDLDIQGLYALDWPLKSSNATYGGRFEVDPKMTAKLTVLEQVSGADFTAGPHTLAKMRAGGISWLRVMAGFGGMNGTAGVGLIGANSGVAGALVTAGGSAYAADTPTVVFSGGGGTGAQGVAVRAAGGTITGIIITNQGTGFSGSGTWTLSGGGGSAGAGTFAQSAGKVITTAVTAAGSGYTFPYVTTAGGGGGTGVDYAAVTTAGVVTQVVAGTLNALAANISATLQAGSGFTSVPTLTIVAGGAGTGATAIVLLASAYSLIIDHVLLIAEGEPVTSVMEGKQVVTWPFNVAADTLNNSLQWTVTNGTSAL